MSAAMLKADRLMYAYAKRFAVKNVSLALSAGTLTSVIGPNGSGKTTLLRLLAGLIQPISGSVTLKERELNSIPMSKRAQIIAVVNQNERNVFPFSCLETILFGLHPHRLRFEPLSEEQMNRVEQTMELTETDTLASRSISEVSGGEYQRVILARAIVQQPKVLLLDEAMSDFDVAAKIRISKCLRRLAEVGMTILSVNHDLNLAYQFSDHILAMHQGELTAFGTPNEVITAPFLRRVFGIEAEFFPGKGFLIRDEAQ